MAISAYGTDLIDISTADSATGWTEPTGAGAGGNPVLETDYFLQGTNCITKGMNATGLAGLAFTNGTNLTFTGNTSFYIWNFFGAPNSIDIKANGGIQVIVGNSAAAYYRYYVNGSDTYTYGGWICYIINPNFTPRSGTPQGTPNGNWATFGMVVNNLNALGQGRPFAVDAIRYGRGSLLVWEGDAVNGYATFSQAATFNDNSTRRLGILQLQDGAYKFQGRLALGTTTTATQFVDSNVNITIQNTEYVNSDFNLIEISNASSFVSLTTVNINSLGTQAPGDFIVTDNAAVILDGCTFNDLGYFTFRSNTTATDVTFRQCKGVNQGGAEISQCLFAEFNTSTSALFVDTTPTDIQRVTDCEFISTGSGHAVNLGTISSSVSVNWNGNILTNYPAGSAGTFVGATGSAASAITASVASNNTLTISVINGATIPSVQNTGAGTVVVESNVTVFIAVTDTDTTPIVGAQVAVYAVANDLEIYNNQTDNNGEVTFGYSSSVPIYIRVRKSTTGSTRYRPLETTGNTGVSGASFFLTLVEDTFVELAI
jgi:hypothetical protein